MCSDRTSSFWPKNTGKLKFLEKTGRKRVSFYKLFFLIQIEIKTVVMTSRSQKLAHLEISLRFVTGENLI